MRKLGFHVLSLWAALWMALCMALGAGVAGAQGFEEREVFGDAEAGEVLRVISNADIAVFHPILQGFITENPGIAVDYAVIGSTGLYDTVRRTGHGFDVAISSAMDLQMKLANDGFGMALRGIEAADATHWRQTVFGFTAEPAAMILNRAAFDGLDLPRSRQALLALLRAHPDRFRGRVGTYDIRRAGLGYLFAAQDARSSETYWRLMEVMGTLQPRLYCCSGAMIDDLEKGRLAVAYNVLGSYARQRGGAGLDIIVPEDFATVMMRSAMVLERTERARAAERFVQYLVSARWQAKGAPLPPLTDADQGIALEPGLLAGLDQLKRRAFLRAWSDSLVQD